MENKFSLSFRDIFVPVDVYWYNCDGFDALMYDVAISVLCIVLEMLHEHAQSN